jgi:hypothetical protein
MVKNDKWAFFLLVTVFHCKAPEDIIHEQFIEEKLTSTLFDAMNER